MGRVVWQIFFDFLLAVFTAIISVIVRIGFADWVWSNSFIFNSDILFIMVTSLVGVILSRFLDNIYSPKKSVKEVQIVFPIAITVLIFILYFFGFNPSKTNIEIYHCFCFVAVIFYLLTFAFEVGSIIFYYKKSRPVNHNGMVVSPVSYPEDD